MNSDQSHLSEDTVSQSGWVFADLLVALSVIFLATISFVPNIGSGDVERPGSNGGAQSGSIALEPGKLVRSEGFSQMYQGISVTKLVADIEEFRTRTGTPSTVEVVALQFIGSASEVGERSGILDALEFSVKLQNAGLDEFADTSISLDTSEKLAPGQILVRAVFGKDSAR